MLEAINTKIGYSFLIIFANYSGFLDEVFNVFIYLTSLHLIDVIIYFLVKLAYHKELNNFNYLFIGLSIHIYRGYFLRNLQIGFDLIDIL